MMLLATAVSKKSAGENIDFLPLSVDYQEKFAAAGKIPGVFLKREGILSDYEILISRLVDRALRPLFPDDYHADTQVMISLVSADANIMPVAYAALAASAALAVSDIPFNGPISEVMVAKVDGVYVVNPSVDQSGQANMELIVAVSADNIMMVEGECKEVQESEMLEAIKIAHETIKIQCTAQLELSKEVSASEKRTYEHENHDLALDDMIKAACYEACYAVAKEGTADKEIRKEKFASIIDKFIEGYAELSESQKNDFFNPEKFPNWSKKYDELLTHFGFAKALISTTKNLSLIHI